MNAGDKVKVPAGTTPGTKAQMVGGPVEIKDLPLYPKLVKKILEIYEAVNNNKSFPLLET